MMRIDSFYQREQRNHFQPILRYLGWPNFAFAAAMYYFNDLNAEFPFLFNFSMVLVIGSLLHQQVLGTFLSIANKLSDAAYLRNLYWSRIFTYFGVGVLVSISLTQVQEKTWSFVLAMAYYVAVLEVLVGNFFPSRRFTLLGLAIVGFPPIVTIIASQGENSLILAGLGTVFLVFQVFKLNRLSRFFDESIAARKSSKLRAEELESLLNFVPSKIMWIDAFGIVKSVNQELCTYFGVNAVDLIGKLCPDKLGAQDLSEIKKMVTRNSGTNSAHAIMRAPLVSLSNESRTHDIYARSLDLQDGRGSIVMAIDIQEAINMQQNIENERARSVDASRLASLGEVAAGIAHEIKNPLAIISGYVDLLQQRIKMKDDRIDTYSPMLNKITETVARIVKIINGLKNLSRDSHNDEFSWTPIADCWSDAILMCSEKMKHSLISFRIENTHQDLEILCSSHQINQVILNLVANAIDAINDFRSEIEIPREISLQTDLNEKGFVIKVIDSGPGIKDTSKIFTPFYTTKAPGKGTGLGLSISKKILESHSGQLEYSNDQLGSCFTLRFSPASIRQGSAAKSA
jgi:signal transduction histidine kinase